MRLYRQRILGLAMEEHAILAAEVRLLGSKTSLTRTAEVPFSGALQTDDPQQVGQILRDSLRHNGFSATEAVIGIPARWLLSARRAFPPANPSALASMVRIEAERSFATDLDDLVIDYEHALATQEDRDLLVIAISRRTAESLRAMAQAAGLRPLAIAPTSMVLAGALRTDLLSALMLFLRPTHAELVIRSLGRLSDVRHLSLPLPAASRGDRTSQDGWCRAASGVLAQLAALAPSTKGAEPEALVVWDGIGLAPEILGRIGEPIGLRTELSAGLPDLGIAAPSEWERPTKPFAGAAALAATGSRRDDLPVDFLHSRLEARRPPRSRRRIAWAIAAVIAVVTAAIALPAQWRAEEGEVLTLQQQLESMEPDLVAAQSLAEQVALARDWTDRRPRFLNPLRELTLALPAEGGIWITSLAMKEDLRVALSGKAKDEQTVLGVLDSIRSRPTFGDVKLLYLREAGITDREIAFSLTFHYLEESKG